MAKDDDGREDDEFDPDVQDKPDDDISEPSAANVNLSEIFQNVEALKLQVLQEVITQSKDVLPPLDEYSFNQYMDNLKESGHITDESKKLLYKKLDAIESAQAEIVREAMVSHGEQELKFNNPKGGTVKIDGSCNLLYKVSDQGLKIVEPDKSISKDQAPLCLSLPLQDERGRNMKAKDAKYLFINYGEDGKISHITHPEPIEFTKDGKCCYDIDGKKYYLKIEQKQLDILKRQVEVNRGNEEALDTATTKAKATVEKMRSGFEGKKNASDLVLDNATPASAPKQPPPPTTPKPQTNWVEINGTLQPPPPSTPESLTPTTPTPSNNGAVGQEEVKTTPPGPHLLRQTPGGVDLTGPYPSKRDTTTPDPTPPGVTPPNGQGTGRGGR